MTEDTSDVITQYVDEDLDDLLTASSAASETAHPFVMPARHRILYRELSAEVW